MKSIIRDLMYQNISSTVFAQLLTDCLNDLDKLIKEEKNSSEKSIAIENAWDELKPWKQNMVKNYADRIIPDCRKKDALENLKEKLYENENYINELAKLTLNIAQNSLTETTEKIYTKAAIRLTEKK
jgi:ribosome-interacting GTPase 1